MSTITLGIDEILLDPNNPRHQPLKHQRDLLLFFARMPETRKLAGDISQHGLSPALRPIVMPDDSGLYVVLDGNRRIAAIKLMRDPDLAGPHKSSFEKLARKGGKFPIDIECVRVASREEAKLWLERLHLGKLEGLGQTPWNAAQQARFDPSRYPYAIAVLNKLRPDFDSAFPISTLERILELGKQELMIELANGALKIKGQQKPTEAALRQIINDVERKSTSAGQEIDSRSMNTAPAVRKYVRDVTQRAGGIQPKTRPTKWTQQSQTAPVVTPTPVTRVTPNPLNRKKVIPPGFRARVSDPKLNLVYRELRGLDVNSNPIAAALLFRALLAIGAFRFEENHGQSPSRKRKPRQSIRSVLDRLLADGKITDAHAKPVLALLSDQNSPLSLDTLDTIAHLPYVMAKPEDLKRLWDELTPFLEALLNSV